MDELKDYYLRNLEGRIQALELAREELGRDADRARESISLIAHSLRGSGAAYGFPGISAAAGALEDAVPGELGSRLEGLLAALRQARQAGPDEQALLVVEDDPTGSLVLQELLAAPGRVVVAAENGVEALRRLSERKYSLVLLDLVLPDVDGRGFLMRLRENPSTSSLPVLVMSGKTGELTRKECLSLGADAFFQKPFDLDALSGAVRDILVTGRRPAAARDWAPGSAAPATSAAPGPAKPALPILVADDDPQIARIITHRLGKEGIESKWFDNGEAALEAARTGRFAMAILDVKMPMMDGFELLGRLRELPEVGSLPILMLTSLGKEADVVRGFDLGADDYLTKPFSPAELLARIRHLLRGK